MLAVGALSKCNYAPGLERARIPKQWRHKVIFSVAEPHHKVDDPVAMRFRCFALF
jgi:hypothetical protein